MNILSIVFPKTGGLQIKTSTDEKSAGVDYNFQHVTPKTTVMRNLIGMSSVFLSVVMDMPKLGVGDKNFLLRGSFDDGKLDTSLFNHYISLTGLVFSQKDGTDYVQMIGKLYVNFNNMGIDIKTGLLPLFDRRMCPTEEDEQEYFKFGSVYQFSTKNGALLPQISLRVQEMFRIIRNLAVDIIRYDYMREITNGTLFDDGFEFENSDEEKNLIEITKEYLEHLTVILSETFDIDYNLVWLQNLNGLYHSYYEYKIVPNLYDLDVNIVDESQLSIFNMHPILEKQVERLLGKEHKDAL